MHQFQATLFLTLAICAMHYFETASLRMNPPINDDSAWFTASIIVAFVVFLGLQMTEHWQHITTQKSDLPLLLTGTVLGLVACSNL